MPRLSFSAKRNGYHFTNSFTNRVLPGVVNGVQTSGLCGGMVMSALDYWRAGVPIPTHGPGELPADPVSGGAQLPLEGSRLRTYIFDRQMNSLLTKLMFTRWVVMPWFQPQDFHNWAVGSEFELARRQIMLGRPTMLGLWGIDGPTSGHQVLCTGYELNPKKLYIYDPNQPGVECELVPVSPAIGVQARRTAGLQRPRTSSARCWRWRSPPSPPAPMSKLPSPAPINMPPSATCISWPRPSPRQVRPPRQGRPCHPLMHRASRRATSPAIADVCRWT